MKTRAFTAAGPCRPPAKLAARRCCPSPLSQRPASGHRQVAAVAEQTGEQCQTAAAASLLGLAAMASSMLLQAAPALAAGEQFFEGRGGELFQPMKYIGRWYEVASLKEGFAGQGQQDCHCTQGIYTPAAAPPEGTDPSDYLVLDVATFCVHGSPDGRVSGIKGRVSCATPELLALLPEFETAFEQEQDIKEKCVLSFPSIPFIPPEPYNILRTDYETYALVQGAVDRSFVQVYSRTPNPGESFIKDKLQTLAKLGYDADKIRITPQDCPEMSVEEMMTAMADGRISEEAGDFMANTGPRSMRLTQAQPQPAAAQGSGAAGGSSGTVPLSKGIQFDSFRNPFKAFGDVVDLLSGLVGAGKDTGSS